MQSSHFNVPLQLELSNCIFQPLSSLQIDLTKFAHVSRIYPSPYNPITRHVSGITSEPQTETLSARGTNVEFTCVVDRYPPNTVAWYKGEDKIQEYDNRKDVSTEKFLKLEDYSRLSCVVVRGFFFRFAIFVLTN